MSASRLTLPVELYRSIQPPAPTDTTARFGTGPEPFTFRFDVVGRACPSGHAVTVVALIAPTAVRLTTTAVASTGTAATPATCTRNVAPGPTAAFATAPAPGQFLAPVRVSHTRHGPTATNVEAVPGAK